MTPALHIAHDGGGGVDLEAASRAAADFLSALGVAIDTEDLRDTPACWAPCGPTRAAGRSSSRWLAYHTEHFR